MSFVLLFVGLAIILASAEVFTNGIEWLGKKLRLSEGAVGSILAAVGTALPESMIPIIAILFKSGEAAEEIGIGAILGAPFMLSTLAMFLVGLAAIGWRKRRQTNGLMQVDCSILSRDILFFLIVYSVAVGASLMPVALRPAISILLVLAYAYYAWRTVRDGRTLEGSHLAPLYLARGSHNPATVLVVLQVLLALGGIIGGAHLFVGAMEEVTAMLGISALILSLIITPVATELPEKFNSIIWVRQGKDTLALGNITGAMVFQSSVITALGISYTSWRLSGLAALSAGLAILAGLIVYIALVRRKQLAPATLLVGGALYLVFAFFVPVLGTPGAGH